MHLEELTSAQQSFLNKSSVGLISYKLTISSDDGDIVLTDEIASVSPIKLKKRIDLDEKMEQFTASEVEIDLINDNDAYDYTNVDSIFSLFRVPILTDLAHTDTTVDIPYQTTVPFGLSSMDELAGKYFKISDGKVTRQGLITNVASNGSGSDLVHRITFTRVSYSSDSSWEYTIAAGNYLEINQLIGCIAQIDYVLNNVDDVITVYKGVVKSVPSLDQEGNAALILQDAFSVLLNQQLGGNIVEVTSYERTGSPESTGTLTVNEDNVNLNRGFTDIGVWSILITADNGTYYDFTVTLPDGSTKTGRTDQYWDSDPNDYYAYASLIIFAENWDGAFDVGDVINLETYYQQDVSDPHLAWGLYYLLSAHLSSALFYSDTSQITSIVQRLPLIYAVGVFKKPTTVLQACSVYCQHCNISMYIGAEGKLQLVLLQPYLGQDPYDLTGDEDVVDVSIKNEPEVPAVKVYYDYDWTEKEFNKSVIFPPGWNGDAVELKLGFFTTESQALWMANFYMAMHEKGLKRILFDEKFNYGLAFSLGDIFQMTSYHPPFTDQLIMIDEFEKARDKSIVKCRAIDIQFIWGDYAYCDMDSADSNKIIW
jgi:hypothetical protein